MATRSERTETNPDLGVLAGRLLFAVRKELFGVFHWETDPQILGRLTQPNGVQNSLFRRNLAFS